MVERIAPCTTVAVMATGRNRQHPNHPYTLATPRFGIVDPGYRPRESVWWRRVTVPGASRSS
jgi:hypothetical protein